MEVLHTVLLGFVKYFWRDAVQRLKPPEKEVLKVRLSSVDTRALGFLPLAGHTMVTNTGSLVGRDFRAIAQVGPFVLHGFENIDEKLLAVWSALSILVPLVWQPEIENIDTYIVRWPIIFELVYILR